MVIGSFFWLAFQVSSSYKKFYYLLGYIEVPHVLPSIQAFRIHFYAFLVAPMPATFLAHLESCWVCSINQNLAVFGEVQGHCII